MMADLIDRLAFMKAMYHRAFETDGDTMWQSGCWVRYRAVEQVVKGQPSVDAVEVVRCKDCAKCQVDTIFNQYWCGGDRVLPNDFCNYGRRKDGRFN